MNRPFDRAHLKPGDIILYRPHNIFDWLIALKTFTRVSHVEVFVGGGKSVASRNGKGVNLYSACYDNVGAVMRPRDGFDMVSAMQYFESVKGQKYGWRTLLTFILLNNSPVEGHQICSEFASNFMQNGRLSLFNTIWPTYRTPPSMILSTRQAFTVWTDGELFK